MTSVVDRFLRYVKYDTQSDENASLEGKFPSTDKQHELAKLLAQELEEMGADSVYYDSRYGYVYAKILNNSDMGRIPTQA